MCIYLSIYLSLSLYIYIYMYAWRNLPPRIMDFRGFDSGIILILRGGIPRPVGNFPDSSSQAMLVGVMLVGGLGVRINSRFGASSSVSDPANEGEVECRVYVCRIPSPVGATAQGTFNIYIYIYMYMYMYMRIYIYIYIYP